VLSTDHPYRRRTRTGATRGPAIFGRQIPSHPGAGGLRIGIPTGRGGEFSAAGGHCDCGTFVCCGSRALGFASNGCSKCTGAADSVYVPGRLIIDMAVVAYHRLFRPQRGCGGLGAPVAWTYGGCRAFRRQRVCPNREPSVRAPRGWPGFVRRCRRRCWRRECQPRVGLVDGPPLGRSTDALGELAEESIPAPARVRKGQRDRGVREFPGEGMHRLLASPQPWSTLGRRRGNPGR